LASTALVFDDRSNGMIGSLNHFLLGGIVEQSMASEAITCKP